MHFKAKIQDGRQKLWENDFWETLLVHSADILGVKNLTEISISHRFLDKCVFAFYAEFQDGRKIWREDDFEKSLQ